MTNLILDQDVVNKERENRHCGQILYNLWQAIKQHRYGSLVNINPFAFGIFKSETCRKVGKKKNRSNSLDGRL